MTLEQYKEKITDDLLYEMAKAVKTHDRGFKPNNKTEEYWLLDLARSLIHADNKKYTYQVCIRGYGIEIRAEGKWDVIIYFKAGRIIIGENDLKVDCMERAIEDMRYLCGLIPEYVGKYKEAMKNAALEMQKENMIHQIYEASIAPMLSKMLEGTGLHCKTKCNMKTVSVCLMDNKESMKTFYVSYDDFENGLNFVRESISQIVGKQIPQPAI